MQKTVILITGCSDGGIGSSLCQTFAAVSPLIIVYATARKLEALSSLEQYSNIKPCELDVNDHSKVEGLVKMIVQLEGRIDILINNAGLPCPGAVLDQNPEKMRLVFETNVISVLYLCQTVAPYMNSQQRKGKIINIGSIVSDAPTPFAGIYCASKCAIAAITDVLRQELYPFGIQVCLVQPGAIQSNIGKNGIGSIILPHPDSLMAPFTQQIKKRALLSQKPGASTPTKQFADKVRDLVLSSKPLPIRFRYGVNSWTFFLLSFFPLYLVHWFFAFLFSIKK